MRAVVQRVERATVRTTDGVSGSIERGLLVLLGVTHGDDEAAATHLAGKITALRVFEDPAGKMNFSVRDVGGAILCVSQFTLYGDLRRGNRPSFSDAAAPPEADRLYRHFCDAVSSAGIACERGVFGAHMSVELVNDGPVTLVLDTAELRTPRRA